MKSKWICRMWTKTAINGWVSDFESFNTRDEAVKMGEMHNSLLKRDELERDYEVYLGNFHNLFSI